MIYPERHEIQDELELLRKITLSDFSGVAWMDRHDHRIRWLFASGNNSLRYRDLALKPGRGLAGLVIKLGRPVIIDSTMANYDRIKHDYSIMMVEHLQSAAAVPLAIQNEVHGVLLIGSRTMRIYHKNDVMAVTSVADRLVILFMQTISDKMRK